ncbi:PEP-CTERM sorting domain-containing protein [Methylovorus menthalis]|uniref:PEP-CTERM sorting domain-containing protein n=1 Tax=Methylovorus menthalis TaxID=1002227 RepID=UPI001E5F4CC7|nr:PEP-CTERM sorting domain-containing protein [Methylovorus menthalis]MCB4811190.1 PEP-CTERM sorting domain-containing protein [Methylovorus menthalis]
MKFTIAALALLCSLNAQATTIDFESLAVADSAVHSQGASYTEDGYTLVDNASSPDLQTLGTLHTYYTQSTALVKTTSYQQSTTLTNNAGSTFDLLSLDLAEWGGLPSTQVKIVGFFAAGGSISQLLTLDQLYGFQSFAVTGFTNLLSLTITQTTGKLYQLDNIKVVSAVPEVGTTLMLLSGLGLIGMVSRRRSSRMFS